MCSGRMWRLLIAPSICTRWQAAEARSGASSHFSRVSLTLPLLSPISSGISIMGKQGRVLHWYAVVLVAGQVFD